MEFYRQTSPYTGAAAALLMALHEKKRAALTREEEFRIWMRSANLPTRSSSIFALGVIASEHGIPVQIVVGAQTFEYPDYRFKRYKKTEIEDAALASEIHLKAARAAGIPVEEREFTLKEVRQYLKDEKHVLLRVNAGTFRDKKATSKYVLITAHDGGTWRVMDPAEGEIRVDDKDMQEAFDTLVTKKKRDHRMLILG